MRVHPVLDCVGAVRDAVTRIAQVDPTFLSAGEKRSALLELTSAISRLEEIRLRVLAAGQAAGDVAAADGSRDASAWLAHHARLDPGRARHLGHLATALDARWAGVGAALRRGRVDLAQAAVIVRALDALPEHVNPDIRRAAEARLVAEAAHFDPRRLRILGRRILDVVAPELQEQHERRQLEDEEAHASRVAFLRTRRRGDGTTDLRARISDALADRLLVYLQAFTSPRRAHTTGSEPTSGIGDRRPHDRRPYDQRLGHALGALLETIDPARLPVHGGDATTVVVTIDHDALLARIGEAGVALVGDTPISAAQARRLACTARILPVVLGGASEVLDLGRARRLFTSAQRKALAINHPHCAVSDCDIPAPWCEAHHAGNPWSRGGRTDLTDGVLLCSHHHHRAHDPRYDTRRHRDGTVHFHRRQ